LQLQAVALALVPLELATPAQLMAEATQADPFQVKPVLQLQAVAFALVPSELATWEQFKTHSIPLQY